MFGDNLISRFFDIVKEVKIIRDCSERYRLNSSFGRRNTMYYPRIKQIRNEKRITQSKVAEILYITQQQYSLYETGRREIPIDCLCKLANLYGVSIDYLLGRVDERE